MPLFEVIVHDACTTSPRPRLNDIMVWAKSPERARQVAVQFCIDDERFDEIGDFANPQLSTVQRVPTRQAEGVYSRTMHHCRDHS